MALLKFIGGIRLSAALVKCGITLAVALLDLTAGVILTAKSDNKSMGGPFGQWAHQYDVPPRTHRVVREVWLPRATNIQAAYVDYVPFLFSLATFFLCEDNKPIDLVILYCVVMPFYPSSTKRHETRSLATDFPLFNLDAGSMPTLLDSTVSLPFLIQPRHGLVCMK